MEEFVEGDQARVGGAASDVGDGLVAPVGFERFDEGHEPVAVPGYILATHLAAPDKHGPCPIHRCTFGLVAQQAFLF